MENQPDYHFSILARLLRIVTTDAIGKTGFSLGTDDTEAVSASMQTQLMEGILDGRFQCDRDASTVLYNASPTDQRYQTLRTRCIDRLFIAIRHTEFVTGRHSDYMMAFFKCLDLFRASALLAFHSDVHVAEYGFSRALTIAKKYEFTEFEYLIRTYLTNFSSLSIDDHGNRNHHDAMFDLLRTMTLEHFAVASYEFLYLMNADFNYQVTTLQPMHSVTRQQALELLESFDEKHRTHTVTINHFRSKVAYFFSDCKYELALPVFDEWINFYELNQMFARSAAIGEVHISRLECILRMRGLTDSNQIQNPCDFFRVGKTNWCISNLLTIHAYMYIGDFTRAFTTYLNLKAHYSDAIYPTEVYEWRMLLEAYLWIATSIMEPSVFGHPDPQSTIPFRLSTFLNAINEFTGDKHSHNPLVIIAHAFILLIQRNDAEAERRITYLNVYATRYLKDEPEQRLWNCVKAMQKILALRDRPRELRRVMSPYIENVRALSFLPMREGKNEIIQWDMLLEAYVDWEERRFASGEPASSH